MSAIDAATMHARLAPLKKGDAVPGDLFIADYKHLTRQPWTIFERRDLPADGIQSNSKMPATAICSAVFI